MRPFDPAPHHRAALLWPVLAVLLAAPPGRALSSLRFEVQRETTSAAVAAAGQVLLRIRGGNLDDAVSFATTIAERLRQQAELGLGPEALSIAKAAGGWIIAAGADRLCLVTDEAAKLSGTTAQALAESWLANLKRAYAGPYLSLSDELLTVPLGESVGIALRGQPAGQTARIEGIDGGTVTAETTEAGLRLTGVATGGATVRLSRGGAALAVPVQVKPRAGRIKTPVEAVCTGTGTDDELLRAAVASAIHASAELQPGATIDWKLPATLAAPEPGSTGTVPVAVRVSGGEYLATEQRVPVALRGQAWADQPADRLLVSNSPESVASSQLLLRAPLVAGKRSRLLYHHKTIAATALVYEVRLLNRGADTARIHARDAHAGPSPDEMMVGHIACRDYWRQRLAMRGAVLTLPPGTSWTLVSQRTPPQQVFSGLSEFTPLDGGAVEVEMVAVAGQSYLGPATIRGDARAEFSDRYIHDTAFRAATSEYRPGAMWAFLNVGRDPVASVAGTSLLGNFGVEYAIELTFNNPDAADGRFELSFSADGGVARGVLLVDGQILETGLVRPGHQERMLDFTLPPGGKRTMRLRIMPQSGSNYPLRLVGRPFQRTWSGRGAGP